VNTATSEATSRASVVWKYELNLFGRLTTLELPAGAVITHFAVQGRRPCIWAHVNPDSSETEVRGFQIFGTGHPIPPGAKHVGTVLDGDFVWHAFEVRS
jgi:hypothetical protein